MGQRKMSSKIGERLRQKRLAAGYATASEAARRFGWNENTYRSHENTTRNVPREWLVAYAKVYGVTISWLTTGHEEQLSTVGDTGQVVPVVSWQSLPKARGPGMSVRALKTAPAVRHIAFGSKVAEEPIGLPVRDDAMADPAGGRTSIYAGDDVVVDHGQRPTPGEIVLVFDPDTGEHCLRRIEYPTRKIARLVAANPAWPAFDLPADSHHILGVVVAVQRKFRAGV